MNRKEFLALAGAVVLITSAGCGGGGESGGGGEAASPAAPRPAAKAPSAVPATSPAAAAGGGAATGSAAVKGSIKFTGAAPKAAKIRMDADPFCHKQHADGATSEEVRVNANGTLGNVFVYVKSGLEGKTYPVPAEPVVLDQRGCTYHPHVMGIMAGQTFKILNSDDTLHNIHALPKANAQFNLAMPKYIKEKDQKFDKPEVMVPVKCDVHSWMSSYVGVLTHPFYSVSSSEGGFSLAKLPAGSYTIEAWHEKYGSQTQQVTVADGDTVEITFTFQAS